MVSRLVHRIMDEIDRSEGGVAIASTTIHIVETTVLDVRFGDGHGASDS
jgi:hypothetical protein